MAVQRIAALVGDFYHASEGMRDMLHGAAARAGFELAAFTDPAQLPWHSLADFRGLVMAKENRVEPSKSNAVWATPRHESAIADFVAAGGALIGLHNGLASFEEQGPYFQTLRGGFGYHPKEHLRFQVRALPVDHPILTGFKVFELKDEMYFVHVLSSRTTRLLELVHDDYGTSCAAWAHEAGKGRVFCFSPGHTPEVLNDPGYRDFLDQGLRWSLRVEKAGPF
jgi:type 1 glutamine amidotransferase